MLGIARRSRSLFRLLRATPDQGQQALDCPGLAQSLLSLAVPSCTSAATLSRLLAVTAGLRQRGAWLRVFLQDLLEDMEARSSYSRQRLIRPSRPWHAPAFGCAPPWFPLNITTSGNSNSSSATLLSKYCDIWRPPLTS